MKLRLSTFLIFSFVIIMIGGAFVVNAQTLPQSGTLQITKTAYDDFFVVPPTTTSTTTPPPPPAAPDTVFWFLISGYPSPTNPWLPVSTQAAGTPPGTGKGNITLATGSYDIFEQFDQNDWVLSSIDCGSDSTPMPGIGAINVNIPADTTVNCTFKNDYIALGQLKILVNASGSDGNFNVSLTHGIGTVTGFSCVNSACVSDPNGKAQDCSSAGGACSTPTNPNNRNISVAVVKGSGEKTIDLHVDTDVSDGAYTLTPDALKKDWSIDSVSCQKADAVAVGVVNSTDNSISAVAIEPHKTTTCTFGVHQKPGTIDIISDLSADASTITNDLQVATPDAQPAFIYQMGGLLPSSTVGDINIGAGGALYYPLPYYIQLKINNFPQTDTDTVARPVADISKPWAWGKQTITVSPGIYYIQQTTFSGWQPASVTCVQVYKQDQTLFEPPPAPGTTPPSPPTSPTPLPSVGDRIYVDEKGQWVQKCTDNKDPHITDNPGNCCSIINNGFYKDISHSMPVSTSTTTPPPPQPPTAPPLYQYGIPESCSFGQTNPSLNQLNIPLNSNAIAAVPVAPGGRTVCIFSNKKEPSSGGTGRQGGNQVIEPVKSANAGN